MIYTVPRLVGTNYLALAVDKIKNQVYIQNHFPAKKDTCR